jgi:hypothetical protein
MATADPIYVSINNQPGAVLTVLDGLENRRATHQAAFNKRRRVPFLLFLAGLPFIALDFVLGYNFLTFSLITVGLWLAAIIISVQLRRSALSATFPPRFATAREVIRTLRDDPDPRRNLFGHLDLSGAQQPSKLFRTGANASGLPVDFFRDEWLSLKAKLYDGNMLRLSAVDRVKVRRSYTKRSRISGKLKTKPAKVANAQQLSVRLTVNPQVYEMVAPRPIKPGTQAGAYTVQMLTMANGIIDLTAGSASANIAPADILAVLRLAYDQLQRKA